METSTLETSHIKFSVSNPHAESWKPRADLPAGVLVRDLGLADATSNRFGFRIIKTVDAVVDRIGWRKFSADTRVLYCLKGESEFEFAPGETTRIPTGTCLSIPGGMPFNVLRHSADLEVLDLVEGSAATIPCDPPAPGTGSLAGNGLTRFTMSKLRPDSWASGAGRREFLAWRDLGVSDATGGRLRVTGIRALKEKIGKTGWHYHTCGLQVVYYVGGPIELEFEHIGLATYDTGSCICIPPGMPHDELDYTANLELVEISLGEIGTVPYMPQKERTRAEAH